MESDYGDVRIIKAAVLHGGGELLDRSMLKIVHVCRGVIWQISDIYSKRGE